MARRPSGCAFSISTLPGNAERLLGVGRRHWSIENKLQWALNVAFSENHSCVRKNQAPEKFAILRYMALNLLNQRIHPKQFKAAWKEDDLLKVLAGGDYTQSPYANKNFSHYLGH